MLNENRLYSISLGVASLQDGLVGVATALSPAMAGHFKCLLHHLFVRVGLVEEQRCGERLPIRREQYAFTLPKPGRPTKLMSALQLVHVDSLSREYLGSPSSKKIHESWPSIHV